MDWPQSVYYAWVLYGAVSFNVGLYWIQKFYMNNWYGLASDYQSGNPTGFTNYGLAETINRLVLLCMWTITAFFWVLTNVQAEWMYWFFTIWARVLHFLDVLRLLTVTTIKTIGVFTDTKQDYLIDNGTDLDTGYATSVSMAQSLSGTDWYMESFGLTVSFSLYGDLLGTSEWAWREQAKCVGNGICQTSVQKKSEAEQAQLDAAKAAEAQVKADLSNFANPDDEVIPTAAGWAPTADVVPEGMNDVDTADAAANWL